MDEISGFFLCNVFFIQDFFFVALQASGVLNPSVPVKIIFLYLQKKLLTLLRW